jgi:hypothetical protein
VSRKSTRQELTTAHEIGHWIDDQALPGHGLSSDSHPDLEPFRQAADASAAVKALRKSNSIPRRYVRYASRYREIWARAYAQFIAMRSGDPEMLLQLKRILDGRDTTPSESQWSAEDFAPIAAAIETLFKKLNWL